MPPSTAKPSPASEADADAPGPGFGGTTTDPLDDVDASVPSRVTRVFASTCAGGPESYCHSSAAAHLTLSLRADGGDVIGVPSTEQPWLFRVKPGDAQASYLVRKVKGAPDIDGGQMPLNGPYDTRLAPLLVDWVTLGAPVE